MSDIRPLRIAQVAPPLERVPPTAYGGTERIVHELTRQLVRRGHEVTVFASGDSDVPCRLIPIIPEPLRPAGFDGDVAPYFVEAMDIVAQHADEFDLIHSHLEWWSIHLARMIATPTVSTFHGRLDLDYSRRLFAGDADTSTGLVAISRSQASVHPELDWTIIHNGLSLHEIPAGRGGDGFVFIGRVERIKGILEAIEIAKLTERPLTIAAKVAPWPEHQAFFKDVFLPAVEAAGSLVEYVGEVEPRERDRLLGESYATLMPGAWPEPFGLVAIESLAAGTPVLARRVGGLPEIIREGVDGFFGDDAQHLAFLSDDVERLDRNAIRERVVERFSAARMADRYEELYLRRLEDERPEPALRRRPSDPSGPSEPAGPDDAVVTIPARSGRDLPGGIESVPTIDTADAVADELPARALPGRPVSQLLRPVGPGRALAGSEDDPDLASAIAVAGRTRQTS